MSRFVNSLPLAIGMLVLVGAFYMLARQMSNISSDAFISLTSVIIGALIATASQSWISWLDRRHQLRLAALDRRLEAHQQAYSLWRKLLANTHNEETIGVIVFECQEWWNNNCLYLDHKAREAFYRAYNAALDHKQFVKDRDSADLVKRNWADIMAAGSAIVSGVALPTIGEESKIIDKAT